MPDSRVPGPGCTDRWGSARQTRTCALVPAGRPRPSFYGSDPVFRECSEAGRRGTGRPCAKAYVVLPSAGVDCRDRGSQRADQLAGGAATRASRRKQTLADAPGASGHTALVDPRGPSWGSSALGSAVQPRVCSPAGRPARKRLTAPAWAAHRSTGHPAACAVAPSSASPSPCSAAGTLQRQEGKDNRRRKNSTSCHRRGPWRRTATPG